MLVRVGMPIISDGMGSNWNLSGQAMGYKGVS